MVTVGAARASVGLLLASLLAGAAWAQPVPQPFPRPNDPARVEPAPAPQPQPPASAQPPAAPDEATLGLPVYPGAEYLATYDAGLGQRYYLFGTKAPFADIVNYYKIMLRDKGEVIFDAPATHMFEVGKFREETMVFPPGVTVKDYTWNGSQGYMYVKGSTATRYPTIIQIVPPPR